MTTKELWAKIAADGIEHVLDRYAGEPTDNPLLAELWDSICEIWKTADAQLGRLEDLIEQEAGKP